MGRGYAFAHPDDAEDPGEILVLKLSDAPGGQVWFVCVGEDTWFVAIAFGKALWPPLDVMRAMDGVAPKDERPDIPLVGGHVDTVLRVLDRMHGDRAAAARANELLHREPPDEPPGANDPCWCGSGKKFKRCHGTRPHP